MSVYNIWKQMKLIILAIKILMKISIMYQVQYFQRLVIIIHSIRNEKLLKLCEKMEIFDRTTAFIASKILQNVGIIKINYKHQVFDT